MFCLTGSTAFGTMACRPARPARPTSQKYVPCCVSSAQTRPPTQEQKPRSPRSLCANHALAAVAPCASSKSFAADKNQCRAGHHGSGPHDTPPVRCQTTPPAASRRPSHLMLRPSSFGAKHDSSHARTINVVRIIERVCARLRRHAHRQPHP